MEESLKILESFYESIKSYRELTAEEARDMYYEILEEKDETIMESKRHDLICSLLHAVYKHIKSKELVYLNDPSFDMDDIINSFAETLVKKVDEGFLLKGRALSTIFDSSFYTSVSTGMISEDVELSENLGFGSAKFLIFFPKYCEIRNTYGDISFDEMKALIDKKVGFPIDLGMEKFDFNTLYAIMEGLYEILLTPDGTVPILPDDRLRKIYKFLMINGLSIIGLETEKVSYNGLDNAITHEVFCQEALQIINSSERLIPSRKEILRKYFLEGQTLQEIGDEIGCSSSAVGQKVKQSLKSLRKDYQVNKYVGSDF